MVDRRYAVRSLHTCHAILVVAAAVIFASCLADGLLNVAANQVLDNESKLLFVGYKHGDEDRIARIGLTNGVVEVFTGYPVGGSDGVCLSVDPRSTEFRYVYFSGAYPNRVRRGYLDAYGSSDAYETDIPEKISCIRYDHISAGLRLFWASEAGDIYTSSETGPPILVASVGRVDSFALDPTTQRIYYLGGGDDYQELRRMDYDGSNDTLIHDVGITERPNKASTNLFLDLTTDYLYFCHIQDRTVNRIKTDGLGLETLYTIDGIPTAVAVDTESDRVYWVTEDPTIIYTGVIGTAGSQIFRDGLFNIYSNGFEVVYQ